MLYYFHSKKEIQIMNLLNLKEQLLQYGEKIGLQVDEETAEALTVHSQITAKKYFTNSVYLRFVVYKAGTIHLFLTFDVAERTYDTLYLINHFNDNNPWFRAYITNIKDKDYLELHYTAICLKDEQEVMNTFAYLMNDLLNEDTLKLLTPILNAENI